MITYKMVYHLKIVEAIKSVFVRNDNDYCIGYPERYVDIDGNDELQIDITQLSNDVVKEFNDNNITLREVNNDLKYFTITILDHYYETIVINIRINLHYDEDPYYNIKEFIISAYD